MRYPPPFSFHTLQLALFTLILLGGINAKAQIPSSPFPNSHFITIDSVTVHFRSWNDDIPDPKGKVLFIHGYAGSTFCFRYLYDTLAVKSYQIISFDLPGCGYSERDPAFNQSHSNRAMFIWKLLDQLEGNNTSSWNIIGHSMGGAAAEAMAILHPDRTETLTIIDGMVFKKNSDLMHTLAIGAKQKQIKKFYINYTENKILTYKALRRMLTSAYRMEPDSSDVSGYLEPLMIPGTAEALLNIYTNNQEVLDLHADSLLHLPVLVIWGTKDSWIPLRNGKRFLKYVPTATLETIPGAGHSPMETHVSEFLTIFLSFLNQHN